MFKETLGVIDDIKKLLVLQGADMALAKIKFRLENIPLEIEILKDKIKAARGAADSAHSAKKALEVKRLGLRTQRLELEEKASKYKTQLLGIKKNEEFHAMQHQIESVKAEISAVEESEIELLYAIDEAVKEEALQEANFAAEKSLIEGSVAVKEAEHKECLAALKSAQEAAALAMSKVDSPAYLDAYLRVKKMGKRQPVVVAVQNGKCDGCHLSVSRILTDDALKNEKPLFCEQCGRIIWRA